MKKIFLITIAILTLLLTVSCVCADENATDVVGDCNGEDDLSESVGEIADDAVGESAAEEMVLESADNEVIGESAGDDVVGVSADASLKSQSSQKAPVASSKSSQKIAVAPAKGTSKITPLKYTSYAGFKTKINVQLTVNGRHVAGKQIKVSISGKRFTLTTDKNGVASFNVVLSKGSHTLYSAYSGDSTAKSFKGQSKINTKPSIGTYFRVADKDISYREGSKCVFGVKFCDAYGKGLAKQQVRLKVNGRLYKVYTNSLGYAKIYVSLKKGTHKVYFSFWGKAPYRPSTGSTVIKVKPAMGKGNGYWVWTDNMFKLNFKSLKAKGTKQLFLHIHSISVYGKSAVQSWINRANSYGMKVHLWMQICYGDGGWVSPVRDDGSFKYGFIHNKVREAVSYAKMKGVAGVHLDYVRYGGTAHKHINAIESINYIVKKTCQEIRKVRPNCIVSVAVMPEPSMMHYYYGQDIPTISKYVDAIIPMVYRGNYGQSRAWVTSVTNTFVKQSNGAQIWTGLQGYVSDSNAAALSHSTMIKDAKAAKSGGATGSIIFRYGYSPNLNFNWV